MYYIIFLPVVGVMVVSTLRAAVHVSSLNGRLCFMVDSLEPVLFSLNVCVKWAAMSMFCDAVQPLV